MYTSKMYFSLYIESIYPSKKWECIYFYASLTYSCIHNNCSFTKSTFKTLLLYFMISGCIYVIHEFLIQKFPHFPPTKMHSNENFNCCDLPFRKIILLLFDDYNWCNTVLKNQIEINYRFWYIVLIKYYIFYYKNLFLVFNFWW